MSNPTQEALQIVILGGSGDLAQRKLLPALFDLYIQNKLPEVFQIIGLGRTKRTHAQYQEIIKEAVIRQRTSFDKAELQSFCAQSIYIDGSLEDTQSYIKLREALALFEEVSQTLTNKLFYLAVPPAHYESIFTGLHTSKLTSDDVRSPHWSRILVEKPFGSDFASARELDQKLSALFDEKQIFRIDHYLAKEAVQNILSFRFANTLIRSTWNRDFIQEVHINMFEANNVQNRGAFYDSIGALRDVGQNHLLQMLALIAMDEPASFTANQIQKNRAAILSSLQPITANTVQEQIVRGQYDGYQETQGVSVDSNTETYFEFKTYIDSPVWDGVPFIVKGGKALKNDEVYIEVVYKNTAPSSLQTEQNSIILTISPVQSMNITLNVKAQGHGFVIDQHTLSFAWEEEAQKSITAYEKVLLDCIDGDQTLFTKTEELLASWKFISSIMEHWDSVTLQKYQEGSEGPEYSLAGNTQ